MCKLLLFVSKSETGKFYQVLGCRDNDIKDEKSPIQGNVQLDPERTHS